jgi:hypothetical protein
MTQTDGPTFNDSFATTSFRARAPLLFSNFHFLCLIDSTDVN